MTLPNARRDDLWRVELTDAEDAIARSVYYAALFDYPLTLWQLRQTLIGSRQTASEIRATFRNSSALQSLVEEEDGYYFPAGRPDLLDTRRRREARSRSFLAAHRPLLHIIAALPFVRMVALSGSIAHMNLEAGGDLDIFLVTRGARVWSTAVTVIVLARLLRRRRTLCANFIVADSALAFGQQDLFTASQIINLKPLIGQETYRQIVNANPFVRQVYPNFHPSHSNSFAIRQSRVIRVAKATAEFILQFPSMLVELACRKAYRAYLRRGSARWQSPEQVTLDDTVLKLHTRSHRQTVLTRFDDAVGAIKRSLDV